MYAWAHSTRPHHLPLLKQTHLHTYTQQARDINLDIKRVVAYRHWCNKLYNAIRFATMNLPEDYTPPAHPTQMDVSALPATARWLLSKLSGASAATVKVGVCMCLCLFVCVFGVHTATVNIKQA